MTNLILIALAVISAFALRRWWEHRITVHRIAVWYKLGHSPEEIARRYGHLTEAQVHAALAYYHANRDEIEAELAADEADADRIEREYLREKQPA